MRTGQFKKTEWEQVDCMLQKELKTTLSIPDGAANEYLYGHRKHGCVGIPIASEESELNLVDTAFKLLTSKDEFVQQLAESHLMRTVRQLLHAEPSDANLGDFMSGDIEGRFATSTNKLSNT
ncbi:reverse transcriptase domain-containing protein [Caerostris darwini]|uniref:Reverse transcriptase domain-containing protein n=1 Tax=Caerostris darwini TaxID=1538125 RepID=A0AAV4TCF6_9ARAC|nr:reverse transcriptase domain-containing protein [Caerostris darwini]